MERSEAEILRDAEILRQMEILFEGLRFHSIEGGRDLGIYQPYTNKHIKEKLIDALKLKLEHDENLEEEERLYSDIEINCAKQFMGINKTSFVLIRYYNYSNFVYFMSHYIGNTQYDFVVHFNENHPFMLPISVQIVDKITHVKSARGGVRK